MKQIMIALGLGSFCLLSGVLPVTSAQETAANTPGNAVPYLDLSALKKDVRTLFPEAEVTLDENTICAEYHTQLRTLTRSGTDNSTVKVKITAPRSDGFMISVRFGVGSILDEPIVRSGALNLQKNTNPRENDYYFATAEADTPGKNRYAVVQIRYGDSIDVGRVKAAYKLLQRQIPGLPKVVGD